MKKIALTVAFALFSTMTFAQETWNIDPNHSSVNFKISHMGINFVQGRFNQFEGDIKTQSGKELTNARINFSIDVSSVYTGVEMRDNHLKSPDFFEVARYPKMKFESTSFKKDKGNTYLLSGNFTIKDVTKKITIPVTYGGVKTDRQGREVMGFYTTFTINRFDYNINFEPKAEVVTKNVDITLFLEFIKQ